MNPIRSQANTSLRRAVTAGVLAVLAGAFTASAWADNTKPLSPDDAIRYADALSMAFENAAQAIQPSVVTIHSVKHFHPAAQLNRRLPLRQAPSAMPFDDPLLRQFFGQRLPQDSPQQQGVGSGVIVSDDGYILTNNHVVDGADRVTVTLHGGREVAAKVVGADPMSDLAVIQVPEHALPAARLGDSDQLRVGEWVVAAGDPFGLSDTITAGIVSAKGRANVRIAEYEDFIQTDAAINPGNSGGPLVDLHGRVVGINTAIASHNGGNNGVGFAIPINMARSIMASLIEKGQVVRGWLGLGLQPLNEGIARSFGYESTDGALVGEVLPGGPAESAGVRPGDIVSKLGDSKITDVQQLRTLVAGIEPHTKVALTVFRDGEQKQLNVVIGEREDPSAPEETAGAGSDALGLAVAPLTSDDAAAEKLPEGTRGVLVTAVHPDSLAARAGIEPGDLVLEVQGHSVSTPAEFRRQLSQNDPKHGVRLLVRSGERQRYVFLEEAAAQ